ncbi:transcriptional regulator, TetR family [Terribacillus aidingensis]|uniref:Transcriptional regulator, TetR family n=1 Tax=Terribacillus aidingensis TaxID=586416 RepID=A0A285NXM0_9BACI|nr:TetR/AcrR family transcriptional regulator [Terribacillus aidingensis]SNZ14230.1 transcriptional regulator, TetR family [Terribacillus aidingensis]
MDRKTEILLAAKQKFAEFGFQQVSMQSIAEACKISKASIYKLFDSKESLLDELLQYNHQQLTNKAALIEADKSLSAEARFERKIVLEIESFKENKHLIQMLMFSPPFKESSELQRHMNNVRATLMKWHQDMILNLYGEKAEPFKWDMTLNLLGLLNPYLKMLADGVIIRDPAEVAHELKLVMDAIVTDKLRRAPLLDEQHIQLHYHADLAESPGNAELMHTIFLQIQEITTNTLQDAALTEAADHLEKELAKDKPTGYLVEALLTYLDQQSLLKECIRSVRLLM